MSYYIYILSNKTNVAIYTGVTNDLVRRVYEHKNDLNKNSFCSKYGIHKLVYYEVIDDVKSAISREKQIKGWKRAKKNDLVESMNPDWKELYDFVIGAERGTDSSLRSE
ncbi:MAG: GIY-YIG nuclease family protein [Oscillospiraceae bacterium]|nr:GIY-YIG nuclease family protein [Oscillospiraceae bacterium]